jgi:geranylgeranyl pyrophosphate synthase
MQRTPSPAEQAFLATVSLRIDRALAPSSSASASTTARAGSLTALPGASLEQAARRLVLSTRAKRARALLCAAVGRHLGADLDAVADCAAAIELVHGASLLHDDVVDEASVRRGEPTARATGGNAFAVLCGDLVLARALALLSPHGPAVLDATVAVVDEMTRAALVEIEDRGRLDVPLARWRAMAEGKTGALFGLCARLPALLVRLDDVDAADAAVFEHRASRLERSMRGFGVAFQIVDDVVDLQGSDPGKPRGQDVREQNPSMPILAAVARDPGLAGSLARVHGDADDALLVPLCERLLAAGRPTAVDAARACVQDAVAVLGEDASGLHDVVVWARTLVDASLYEPPGNARTDEGIPARAP